MGVTPTVGTLLYRREDPAVTELYDDRLLEARSRRYKDIATIGVEHNLPRSYSTIEECKALAKAAFAGARTIRTQRLAGTAPLDSITEIEPNEGTFSLGGAPSVIEGVVDDDSEITSNDSSEQSGPKTPVAEAPQAPALEDLAPPKRSKPGLPKGQSMKFARPSNLKELK